MIDKIKFKAGSGTIEGDLSVGGRIFKPSGTSNQFLKADGSLDDTSYVPGSRKINTKPLSGDITLNLDDIGDGEVRKLSDYFKAAQFTQENIKNTLGIYDWALAASKPGYSLSEISGTDDLRAIEGISETSGLLRKNGENTWVLDNSSYITGITSGMVTTALGFTPFDSASFTKSNIQSTLGISGWALESTKPGYSFSEISGKVTNDQLTNSSVSISGETVSLGGSITQASLRTALGLGSNAYTSTEYATAASVTTLQGYFTSGVANSAAKLSDTGTYTAWGQTFFTNGKPASISNASLSGVTNINTVIYFGTSGVGIGVSNPSTKLHVDGTITATALASSTSLMTQAEFDAIFN